MRGINYQFGSFEELTLLLEAGNDEKDLELSISSGEVSEGDWVIAEFVVGDEKTSVAACVVDRGDGLRLSFGERDWQSLWHFVERSEPPPPAIPTSIPPPPPMAEAVSAGGSHVLIIDNDSETQMVVRELLQSSGYLASVETTAESAFQTLKAIPIDLVLVEWTLPGMSGLDFCERVRRDSKLKHLPVIFLSTHSAGQDVMRAFEAGADDYITKPFRAVELAARVMGLIRRSRMPAHSG